MCNSIVEDSDTRSPFCWSGFSNFYQGVIWHVAISGAVRFNVPKRCLYFGDIIRAPVFEVGESMAVLEGACILS